MQEEERRTFVPSLRVYALRVTSMLPLGQAFLGEAERERALGFEAARFKGAFELFFGVVARLGLEAERAFGGAEPTGTQRQMPRTSATLRHIFPLLPSFFAPQQVFAGNGGEGRVVYFFVV